MWQGSIYTTEGMSVIITLILIVFMHSTKSKRTTLLVIEKLGLTLSLALFAVEQALAIYLTYAEVYNVHVIDVLMYIFIALYLFVLGLIILFVNQLICSRPFSSIRCWIAYWSVYAIYLVGAIYHVYRGLLYEYVNGTFEFTGFIPYFVFTGIVGATGLLINVATHKNDIPQPLFTYITIFLPVDIVLLVFQFIYRNDFIIDITITLPFLLYYIIFHANIYDNETGCQGADPFYAAAMSLHSQKRKYVICMVYLPKLTNSDFARATAANKQIIEIYAETCRMVEYSGKDVLLYRLNVSSFAVIYKLKRKEEYSVAYNALIDVLEKQCKKANVTNFYKIVALRDNKEIDSPEKLKSLLTLVYRHKIDENTDFYFAKEEDYKSFGYHYYVEQQLLDIRNNQDLNDERVQVYVQPIHSIKDDQMRTGEALMRLVLDGKMAFPDVFIPIAESNDCIHTLTKIILNKVCKATNELKSRYDYDAITVNVSSTELSDPRFYGEVMSILNENGTDPSCIRFELTESAIFTDMKIVMENVKKLHEEGILFYLDDFGTGYSNLERIVTFPFYTIKFDKALLYRAQTDDNMRELVEDMIVVFKKKKFHALVEGVEDEAQKIFCEKLGFEFIQGYYYSKPVPIEEFNKFLIEK